MTGVQTCALPISLCASVCSCQRIAVCLINPRSVLFSLVDFLIILPLSLSSHSLPPSLSPLPPSLSPGALCLISAEDKREDMKGEATLGCAVEGLSLARASPRG